MLRALSGLSLSLIPSRCAHAVDRTALPSSVTRTQAGLLDIQL